MIAPAHTHHPRCRQHGVALVMAMVFLLLLTLIGVTAMNTTSLEEKMAGNLQDKNSAFQAAETGLRVGEALIRSWAVGAEPDFTLNTAGYYEPAPAGSTPVWGTVDWKNACGTAVICLPANSISGVKTQPRYIIEKLGDVTASSSTGGSLVAGFAAPAASSGAGARYRVTAHGTGGTDAAVAELQSVYRK